MTHSPSCQARNLALLPRALLLPCDCAKLAQLKQEIQDAVLVLGANWPPHQLAEGYQQLLDQLRQEQAMVTALRRVVEAAHCVFRTHRGPDCPCDFHAALAAMPREEG